ncbi:MAG TPA: JAB domain-containing protein [Candidatus Acetothermia bacterium]|nr:DNA repair protein RadC [Candidatus Bipolaricaulota bacterium]HDJ29757.1 JAB domain-containing protein [Candidatus Acetothermia bacterium]
MRRTTIKDIPELDRPREKLIARGAGALSDAELLAVIIGRGIPGRDVLQVAAETEKVIGDAPPDRISIGDLLRIKGMGEAKAAQIVAAFELARRHLLKERIQIKEARDVLPFVNEIRDKRQEYFVCLSLNGAHEVIENRVVTVGLLDSNQVHPREVFADPLVDRAAAVIFAHNHPSGNPSPSPEDIALTKRLVDAGKLLGINVLDHLIVTKRGYLSLKQEGYL